jgi:hypothetical protein
MSTVYGPQFGQNLNRVHPVDPDNQEDENREGRKKKVLYNGRAWTEKEEDLPIQPTAAQETPGRMRRSSAVFADSIILERAQDMFHQLTTLEEKAAQLCFLITEAIYASELQRNVELLIQTWQIGGVLFHKGEYRRQGYLIERYQEISKTPLLMANDFLHGLSFYLQGDSFNQESLSEQHYSDLGKAVMVQNRKLGVQIQFDRARLNKEKMAMKEHEAKAFRKGVHEAMGIVGKEKSNTRPANYSQSVKGFFPHPTLNHSAIIPSIFSEYQVQEAIGFKTLTFYDASQSDKKNLEEEILKGFLQGYDVYLLSNNIAETIRAIARLVRAGKIREEILDRHVMKVLIIKALFPKK